MDSRQSRYFHAFHHSWIEEIARALNRGLLAMGYYALSEQQAAGYETDVLALQGGRNGELEEAEEDVPIPKRGGTLLAAPRLKPIAETDLAYYRRKQDSIAIRQEGKGEHISEDPLVAMIEIVSPGNKSGTQALRKFVDKAAELGDRQIHLLILDLLPPGRRDPRGIHGAIWEEITGEELAAGADKPLTLAAYECASGVRAYVVHHAVGETLTDMPLFLEPNQAVTVPVEATYQSAFVGLPGRWRRVLKDAKAATS